MGVCVPGRCFAVAPHQLARASIDRGGVAAGAIAAATAAATAATAARCGQCCAAASHAPAAIQKESDSGQLSSWQRKRFTSKTRMKNV